MSNLVSLFQTSTETPYGSSRFEKAALNSIGRGKKSDHGSKKNDGKNIKKYALFSLSITFEILRVNYIKDRSLKVLFYNKELNYNY